MRNNLRIAVHLAIHDFRVRYARSLAGPLWLLMTPAALLGIYGLVFGVVLGVRWPALDGDGTVGFVVPFFCGLSTFLYFSDVLSSSANIFVRKRNYVKKSPFPLWVLWLSNFLRCGMQGGVYLLLLLAIALAMGLLTVAGTLLAGASLIGIVLVSAVFSLFFAAVGPFVGDLAEAIRVALRLLFYAAPVTYPLSLVPQDLQFILWLNPLTHMIEPLRAAIVYGQWSVSGYQLLFMAGSAVFLPSVWWMFSRVSRGIPDVV